MLPRAARLGAATALLAVACGSSGGTRTKDGGAGDAVLGGDTAGGDAIRSPDGNPSDGGPGAPCRSNANCSVSTTCARVEDIQCGGFDPRMCAGSGDCSDAGANDVCVFDACGGSRCSPKCTSSSQCTSAVPGAEACDVATGLCGAKPCSHPSDCPTNYACTTGSCAPTMCKQDSDCHGYCVNGLCSKTTGTCMLPRA